MCAYADYVPYGGSPFTDEPPQAPSKRGLRHMAKKACVNAVSYKTETGHREQRVWATIVAAPVKAFDKLSFTDRYVLRMMIREVWDAVTA
jgi:hypothetical protein